MGIYQGSKLMSGGGGGPSPYEIAKQNGYTGTEQAFNQLLAALDQNATEQELNNKADLVNGKVPAEQVDAYTKTEADTLLQNKANTADFQSHTTSKSNPHGVTATQTGAYTKGETDTLLHKKVDKDRAVNPNLLDNWYFGNPVDQRHGLLVPPGTTWYTEAELTNVGGTITGYETIVEKTSTYAKSAGSGYFAVSDCVRGYTGTGYGIDRWKIANGVTGNLIVKDGYIEVSLTGLYSSLMQVFEKGAIVEGTYTLSVLTISGLYTWTFNASKTTPAQSPTGWFGIQNGYSYFDYNTDGTSNLYLFDNASSETISVSAIAAKLELGSQQTLAHQDANGNWVLNEIPDYGEQLRRCQYYSRFFGKDIEIPCSNNGAGSYMEGTLPLTMRSGSGAISYGDSYLFLGNGTFYQVTSANVTSNGGRVKIGVNVNGQMTSNQQATLHLTNCSIVYNL